MTFSPFVLVGVEARRKVEPLIRDELINEKGEGEGGMVGTSVFAFPPPPSPSFSINGPANP